MNRLCNMEINDCRDVEKFLGNFIWNSQFSFDLNTLSLEKAPTNYTSEGKLRYSLRHLLENSDALKKFLINNWYSNISYENWQLRFEERKSLLDRIETCIPYLEEYPIMKENLINRLIDSHIHKSKLNDYDDNYEIDPTWDDFIKDCNEQFNSMMEDMDAWGNID